MLTTVAVLVIVLGLMVSLARDVRTRSAERLTKDLLHRLDLLVAQYCVTEGFAGSESGSIRWCIRCSIPTPG